jgi:hypothetical protein
MKYEILVASIAGFARSSIGSFAASGSKYQVLDTKILDTSILDTRAAEGGDTRA